MTIGDVLLQPENGWIRFDGGDNSITKAGSWLTASHVNYYNGIGHYTQTQGASFSFSFYGRAFRIIDQRSSNRTKNATVMIDGVSETVNFSLANDPNQSVVYEKLNLNPDFHTVTITKNDATSSTLLLSVDAVDIKLPYNKFLISSEDEYCSLTSEVFSAETVVPTMTSNTTPSGRAFSGVNNVSNNEPWKAFDKIDGNEGYLGSGTIGSLGYEFTTQRKIKKYVIRSVSSSFLVRMPKDWTFEGSNDGVKWTVLDNQVNQTWAAIYSDKEFLIDSSKSDFYKMYRLNWTSNGGYAGSTSIGEFKMFESTKEKGLIHLDEVSEYIFTAYGLDKNVLMDLNSMMFERDFVVSSGDALGSGKVFKQKIDTSKTPIKTASIT